MEHPKVGETIEIYILPDKIIEAKVVEWDNDWIRVSEVQRTPIGEVEAISTIRTQHIIRYTVISTVTVQEKDRPAQPVSSVPQKPFNQVEDELLEKVKSLSELRVEQNKAKMSSIRDLLPEHILNKKRNFRSSEIYELPSFKKHTKDET